MKRVMLVILMTMLVCSTFVLAETSSKIRQDFYIGDDPEIDAIGSDADVVAGDSAYDFFNSSDVAWIIGALIFVVVLGSWILYGKKRRKSRGGKKARRKSKK